MILCINSYAQKMTCSTNHDSDLMKRLESNVQNPSLQKSLVSRYIPIELHLVADTDGSSTLTDIEIIEKMCILNDRFFGAEMHFYIAGINRINSTSLNHMPQTSTSQALIRNNKNPNAMNIYLVNEILSFNPVTQSFEPSGAAGYYSGGQNDFIVMLQSTPGDAGHTMEHEIGHFFSLAHTHVGWEGDISDPSPDAIQGYVPEVHGDTVRIEIITGSEQAPPTAVELVDGSNCTTAGDRICDTPPDYGFGQSCNCCTMVYDVWDKNGDRIEPMIDNIMSYSQFCDEMFFTDGQRDVMFADFDSPSRSHLRVGDVNEYTPITEQVAITRPANEEIVESFNGVAIEWDEIPHAEEYYVNISGSQQLQYITSDAGIYIEDLRANSVYLVSVKAVNKFGTGCQESSPSIFFETGSGTTSTNETVSINDVNIYPNPVNNAQNLVIDFNSDKTIDSKIKLHNLQGKVVELINTTFVAGNNKFQINTKSLTSGLYILEINTSEGIISEKIIVE